MKIIKTAIPLLLLCFCMCATAAKYTVMDADNQKSFSLKKGEIIKVELEAQLSTGYGWQVAGLSGVEVYGDTKVITAQKEITGGKDYQYLQFKAVQSGSGFIELKYVQPWNPKSTPAKTYKILISVE
ncbi:MAG: protease inhibitor I42 family protein [Spirochaetota bacterium]